MWPAILGGAAVLGSALIGREGQKDANEQNLASAREQMAFQERMSGSAHAREVADLRNAGLNPVLSARLGGSSSPPGAMATVGNEAAAGLEGAQSAGATQRLLAETKNIKVQTKNNDYRGVTWEKELAQAQAAHSSAELARQQRMTEEQRTRGESHAANILAVDDAWAAATRPARIAASVGSALSAGRNLFRRAPVINKILPKSIPQGRPLPPFRATR